MTEETDDYVTNYPVWPDHPWQDQIPACYIVRKGQSRVHGHMVIVEYRAPTYIKHICHYTKEDYKVSKADVKVMVNTLAGAIVEEEFPGQLMETIKLQAKYPGKFPISETFAGKRLAELKGEKS